MREPLGADELPWLRARARRDPDALALVVGARALTYAQLADATERLAARLVARGVEPGDRVAAVMEGSAELVALVHATQSCGAALVPLGTRLTAAELATLLAHARPRLVVHDPTHAAALAAARALLPSLPLVTLADLEATPAAARVRAPIAPETAHTILYTSGTTGRAKGVVLTNANHAASAAASRANLGARGDDRWLALLPLHHVGGLSIPLRGVLDGAPVVLHPRFDAAAAAAALRAGDVTLVSVVATMLGRLLDRDERPFAPRVRCMLVGGGPVPPALLARARARGLAARATYGLTEAASQVATEPDDGAEEDAVAAADQTRHGVRALPGVDLRIDAPAADGCGEILVRGANVMRGYLDDPAATAAALRDGWLHTGDVGRLDRAGILTVVDRRTDLIVTGGENVYPAEVEAVLHAHPAVLEAAVYARADPEWGQRVAAAIVVRAGHDVDAAELRAWCRTRLAAYKVPRAIARVAALPRTASGKLQRHRLG